MRNCAGGASYSSAILTPTPKQHRNRAIDGRRRRVTPERAAAAPHQSRYRRCTRQRQIDPAALSRLADFAGRRSSARSARAQEHPQARSAASPRQLRSFCSTRLSRRRRSLRRNARPCAPLSIPTSPPARRRSCSTGWTRSAARSFSLIFAAPCTNSRPRSAATG